MNVPESKRLALPALAMTMFFCVSGGPYGLEGLVGESGAGMAVLLILVTPIIWALPAALMTAELASTIPAQGGYYVWVKRAFGPAAGFFCAAWTWIYSWVDVTVYPVLFSALLAKVAQDQFKWPYLAENYWAQWVVSVFLIIAFTVVNVRGILAVGTWAKFLAWATLVPFGIFCLAALYRAISDPHPIALASLPAGKSFGQAFGGGLWIVMWNYLGWDSLSTVAEEVESPQRNYPRAIMIAIPLIIAVYLLPVLAGLVGQPDSSKWTDGAWPQIAHALGGFPLMLIVTLALALSAAGLFSATLLAASRIPFVLANEGYLPPAITKLPPRFGSPYVAIVMCSVIYAIFALKSFETLIVVDVVLYSAGLILELCSLAKLRKVEPALPRPYCIPGGQLVILLVCLVPALLVAFALYQLFLEKGWAGIELSVGALLLAPVAYGFLRHRPWAQ